jgi:hypothetical protein
VGIECGGCGVGRQVPHCASERLRARHRCCRRAFDRLALDYSMDSRGGICRLPRPDEGSGFVPGWEIQISRSRAPPTGSHPDREDEQGTVKMKETGNRTKQVVVLATLALVVLVSTVAVDAAVQRTAPISTFAGVDEIVEACTTGTAFRRMPQMARRFTVGGSASEEVVVMFEGSLSLSGDPSDTGFIRLLIDGVEQSPGVVPAVGAGERGTHGFNWQSAPLSPGLHRARVQWRTDLGGTLCVDARSLIVLHV